MLERIQSKFRLTPCQARIAYPIDDTQHIKRQITKFEAQSLLDGFPKISLPLPIPDMIGEWGVAVLFLRFNVKFLLLTLNLLLLEKSVLVVGTSREEVSCCTLALLHLLDPFEWASAFINSISIKFLEIINSRTPFIAGLVADNEMELDKVLKGDLVRDAISSGLMILDVKSGEVYANDRDKPNWLAFCQTIST